MRFKAVLAREYEVASAGKNRRVPAPYNLEITRPDAVAIRMIAFAMRIELSYGKDFDRHA